ncbi:winged helix-turn-helix domain-containing protein [Halarchaeum sp. P4]|uniref:winged helix-turn-helix domain-containing protein n=1 Tax=Halarchaeum sp. P4 TaxID=3421639 RepID=UPI003EBA68FA
MPPKPGPDREVTDEQILTAIRNAYSPAVGTSDVAERVGAQRQTVDKHLRELAEEGLVETRMIGRVRVWWLSDDGRRYIDDYA